MNDTSNSSISAPPKTDLKSPSFMMFDLGQDRRISQLQSNTEGITSATA